MTQHHENNILICETCAGTGAVRRRARDDYDKGEDVTCMACNGSGLVMQTIRYAPYKPRGDVIRAEPQ